MIFFLDFRTSVVMGAGVEIYSVAEMKNGRPDPTTMRPNTKCGFSDFLTHH